MPVRDKHLQVPDAPEAIVQVAHARVALLLAAVLEMQTDVADGAHVCRADGRQELLHRPRVAELEGRVRVPNGAGFEVQLATGKGQRELPRGGFVRGKLAGTNGLAASCGARFARLERSHDVVFGVGHVGLAHDQFVDHVSDFGGQALKGEDGRGVKRCVVGLHVGWND